MKKTKHIFLSTALTIAVCLLPMLFFKKRLPSEVPIHWDMKGNVNGTLSQTFFVYGAPIIMGIVNLIGCYKYSDDFSKNTKLYYIIPFISLMITLLMLYLALK